MGRNRRERAGNRSQVTLTRKCGKARQDRISYINCEEKERTSDGQQKKVGWKSKQCEWEGDAGHGVCKQQQREGSSWKGQIKGLKSEKLTSRGKRSVTGN